MRKIQICFRQPKDITELVEIVNQCEYDVDLKSGNLVVDAKSLLGVIAMSNAKVVDMIIHSEECSELLHKVEPYLATRQIA
jgi:phosphotransferase system HPr-like phosphotransfer protein